MKPFFNEEDFICALSMDDLGRIDLESRNLLAKKANAKLQKIIEAAPVVYAEVIEEPFFKQWHNISYQGATHSARLMFIEPIVKEECKHQGRSYPTTVLKVNMINSVTDAVIGEKYKCKHCGVELKPTWEVVK